MWSKTRFDTPTVFSDLPDTPATNDMQQQPCVETAVNNPCVWCIGPYLQAVGLDALQHQALKQGLAQPCPGCLLVDDDRPQLAVVPHQHSLLGSQDQGNECLRLCRLRGLIYQQLQAEWPVHYMHSEQNMEAFAAGCTSGCQQNFNRSGTQQG